VDRIEPEALLFQTGYLTLQSTSERVPGRWVYTLGYPNREVESSLNAALLQGYGGLTSTINPLSHGGSAVCPPACPRTSPDRPG
jgi:hypothetical protein